MQCNLERSEDKARWHVSRGEGGGAQAGGTGRGWGGQSPPRARPGLPPPQLTLLLVLEDRLHRQLTYDLLPSKWARQAGRPPTPDPPDPRPPPWGEPLVSLSLCPRPHASPALRTADSAQDLAAELVHYGFLHEVRPLGQGEREEGGGRREVPVPMPTSHLQDDRPKLAAFLESTFLKYRGAQ